MVPCVPAAAVAVHADAFFDSERQITVVTFEAHQLAKAEDTADDRRSVHTGVVLSCIAVATSGTTEDDVEARLGLKEVVDSEN